MNNQAVLSSHYLPCLAYFKALANHPVIHIDLGEHFIKQTYRNRAVIYTSNGSLSLSIPVIRKNKTVVKDVLLNQENEWKTTHWKAITTAYNSSPFFEFYETELKKVLFNEYRSLYELNDALLLHLCKEIGLYINPIYSNEYVEAGKNIKDYRNTIDPKKSSDLHIDYPRYIQIFEDKHGFIKNLSILDLLFHEGPETLNYIKAL